MAGELPGRIRRVLDLTIAGDHEEFPEQPVFAAPASPAESNRIRSSLFPRACFRFEDAVFQFDSSFPLFGQSFDAEPLKAILDENKGARLSIFGHADPSGDDEYNKVLSGRRAQSIFATLIRNVPIWRDLYVKHDTRGKDKWGLRSIQIMLNVVGAFEGAPDGSGVRIDGELDDPTREKLRRFQEDHGLAPAPLGPPPDRLLDATTFAALVEIYMNVLCLVDAAGNSLRLTNEDFLAQGEGKDGKGDIQGCSEFNPILVFSQQENREFQRNENHDIRNEANRPNRRVMVLIFRPGSRVDPRRWPCPSVKEGTAGCRKRFFRAIPGSAFQNGDVRRAPQAERREFGQTRDTFACRFYDRMVSSGPCEVIFLPALASWDVDEVESAPSVLTKDAPAEPDDPASSVPRGPR
jgi:outer membrane protein OmpA-like peptidoglycan-associated protein